MTEHTERWTSDDWRAIAEAWIDDGLADAGRVRTGPVEEVRVRPWGAVLSAPTAAGPVFMKATAPGTRFEAGLYELLVRTVPDRVLHPLAVDVDAGWLLLPDGGPTLDAQVEGAALLEALVDVAAHYAQLQVDLAPAVDDLLAVGVADMRPARMLERFDEAVANAREYAEADARVDRVAGLRDVVGTWCDRLAAAPGGASLDHNDLHGGNVFAAVAPGGRQCRFFDWGDSVVAHPFATLLVLRSVVRWVLEVESDTPEERRVVDAYLEPFGALAPRAELLEVVDLACEVGNVARSLVWARAVEGAGPADDPEHASAPLDWLLELLDGPLAKEAGA